MEETTLPPDFGEAAFLLKTGWTHADYEATPDELVSKMVMLLNAEGEAAKYHLEQAKKK